MRLAGEYGMAHLTNDFRKSSAGSRLYCVWVPLHDDGRPPLISIWTDSKMSALETRPSQESTTSAEAGEDVMAEEMKDPRRAFTVAAIGVDSAAEPFSGLERRRQQRS